ncbi:hypothetical protein Pfo_011597 [Paulownia fortunei]|nr:hypothetical protein Pfo_011597 [Paulownia fortunei]
MVRKKTNAPKKSVLGAIGSSENVRNDAPNKSAAGASSSEENVKRKNDDHSAAGVMKKTNAPKKSGARATSSGENVKPPVPATKHNTPQVEVTSQYAPLSPLRPSILPPARYLGVHATITIEDEKEAFKPNYN